MKARGPAELRHAPARPEVPGCPGQHGHLLDRSTSSSSSASPSSWQSCCTRQPPWRAGASTGSFCSCRMSRQPSRSAWCSPCSSISTAAWSTGSCGSLGLPRLAWLNSTGLSKIPVMVLAIWRATPWYMLILLSGLQAINPELYQAATVDGAGPVQKLFRITIPSLATVLFFCFLTETIDSFRHLHRAVHHDGRRAGVLLPFHRAVSL